MSAGPHFFQNTNPTLGPIHNHSDHKFRTECGVTRGCGPLVRNDSKPSGTGPEKAAEQAAGTGGAQRGRRADTAPPAFSPRRVRPGLLRARQPSLPRPSHLQGAQGGRPGCHSVLTHRAPAPTPRHKRARCGSPAAGLGRRTAGRPPRWALSPRSLSRTKVSPGLQGSPKAHVLQATRWQV